MKFKLNKISHLSGNKASIYSVNIDNSDKSLFELFLAENIALYLSEINDIIIRIKTIGGKTGARDIYFKLNEGSLGDGIAALYDEPQRNLRLYCIKYGNQIIILGGGGFKKKNIKALQDDTKLKDENYLLRKISKHITKKMNDEIFFSTDGLDFYGNLEFDMEEL